METKLDIAKCLPSTTRNVVYMRIDISIRKRYLLTTNVYKHAETSLISLQNTVYALRSMKVIAKACHPV